MPVETYEKKKGISERHETISFKQTVRTKILATCTERQTNLRTVPILQLT